MFFILKELGNGLFPEKKLSERNIFIVSEDIDIIFNSYELIKERQKACLVII